MKVLVYMVCREDPYRQCNSLPQSKTHTIGEQLGVSISLIPSINLIVFMFIL
jgi:hypothetical protein